MTGKGILWVWLFAATASHRASAEAPSFGGGPTQTATSASQSAPESMVRIPGGGFFSGRQPSEEFPSRPVGHEVTVSDFWIDRTEVTTGEYLACERARACPRASRYYPICNARAGSKRRQYPINCVSAPAADSFCRWKGKRLPSEEEWERAARGSDRRIFPWGNSDPKDQLCWNPDGDSSKSTCPVGRYPKGASPYGVLDMAGNVAEWTSSKPDWYTKGDNEKARIFRGGSYEYDEMEVADDTLSLRSDERDAHQANMELPTIGFRCARDIDVSAPPASAKSAPGAGKVTSTADQAMVAATPPRGSPERKELLDAVRARLHTMSEFEVVHLAIVGSWAYFEGREHRPGGGPAAALLQRSAAGNWQVVDVMGEAGTTQTFDSFRKRIRNPNAQRQLPKALFR
jgi:formylglycine-generating enzyme required for sulfatase activity